MAVCIADDLFSWKIDWQFVDQELITTRIRPWVSKKINEYIGEVRERERERERGEREERERESKRERGS